MSVLKVLLQKGKKIYMTRAVNKPWDLWVQDWCDSDENIIYSTFYEWKWNQIYEGVFRKKSSSGSRLATVLCWEFEPGHLAYEASALSITPRVHMIQVHTERWIKNRTACPVDKVAGDRQTDGRTRLNSIVPTFFQCWRVIMYCFAIFIMYVSL